MSGPQTNPTPDHGQPRHAEHDAILEQAEAYVLGALDRVDSGIIEQHLRWCPHCRDEVTAIERVVDLLPLTVPQVDPPPPGVKARLFARVAAENQAAPYAWQGLHRDAEPDAQRAGSTKPVPGVAGNRSGGTASGTTSWLRFLPPAIIAPLGIALIVVGAWANSMRLDLEEQERNRGISNQRELNQIVANGGDVRLYAMEPQCTGCSGRGRIGVDVADRIGVVVAWGLNPDQEYEVWCFNKQGDKKMVSTLDVDAQGGAMQGFSFPEDMSDYSGVYVAQTNGEATYMSNFAPDNVEEPGATPDQ